MTFARPVIGDIISQHAEQAAFLWQLRDRAVVAPHYAAKDVAALDSRIDGHLDGLRVAGMDGWVTCVRQLGTEAGDAFTGASVALADGTPARLDQVVDVISLSEDHQGARGIVSALAWGGADQALPHVERLMHSQVEIVRLMGLAACACLRTVPRGLLELLLLDSSALVRARALRAVGELRRVDLWPVVDRALSDTDGGCRFWAGWSACLIGQQTGVAVMLEAGAAGGRGRLERAADLAARCRGLNAGLRWHAELVAEGKQRLALVCARALGSPRLAPWLFEMMHVPNHARIAGETFTMMTGVDLSREKLDGPKPDGFEAGPNDDPDDEDVSTDPDEDLPWPDVEAVRKWWESARSRFSESQRFLGGKPLTTGADETLRTGFQRQRAAAAIEVALARPDASLPETRARLRGTAP